MSQTLETMAIRKYRIPNRSNSQPFAGGRAIFFGRNCVLVFGEWSVQLVYNALACR